MPIINRGGGGGSGGVKWVTESEIDFAAHGARSFFTATTSHTETLVDSAGNSVDWVAYGNGSTNLNTLTTQFEINASGLQITPTGASDVWNTSITAPRVGPLIADVMAASGGPAYDFFADTVCIQAYITASVDPITENYRTFGILLDRHTPGQSRWLRAVMVHAGAPNASVARGNNAETYEPALPHNATLFEIVVGPRLGAPQGRLSDWAGSFPEPGAALNVSGWAGVEAAAVIKDKSGPDPSVVADPTAANGRLEVVAAASGSGNPFTVTVHKIRYLRLR